MVITACHIPDQTDDVGVEDDRFNVSGTIVGLDRTPVVDVFVTVSTEFCIPDRTAADGTFSVGDVAPGTKRLITYGETGSNGLYASVSFAFEAERSYDFQQPVRIPRLDETYPIDLDADGIQVFDTIDGLQLTLLSNSLELAPFAPEELQVARMALEYAPAFVPESVTLLDLFVLHPIQSTLDPPAPVAFPPTALAPDTPVLFHSLNYETGLLEVVAHGVISEDGRPTTLTDEGLTELTWIGLSLDSP